MSLKDKLNAYFNGLSAEDKAGITAEELSVFAAATSLPTTPVPVGTATSPSAREQELERQLAEFRATDRTKDATAFVDTAQRGGRLLPAHREEAIALLSAAMQDDADNARMVTFSKADKEVAVSRTALFKAFVESLPKHGLIGDRSPLDLAGRLPGAVVLGSGTDDNAATPHEQGVAFAKSWNERNYTEDQLKAARNGH